MISMSFDENGDMEIDGVRISIAYIKEVINNPPDGLFSFKRVGNQMSVTACPDAESAVKFFKRTESSKL